MLVTEPLQCGTWLFFGRQGQQLQLCTEEFENMNSFMHTYIHTYIEKLTIELSYVLGIIGFAEYHQTKEISPVFKEKVSYVPF